MKSIFTFLFCFILSVAYSQEKVSFGKNLKNRFVNYTEFGVLFGRGYQLTPNTTYSYYSYPVNATTNISFQTFNGVKVYKNMAAGLIVGLDWFGNQQLIPISLGIRNSFGDNSNKKVKTFAGIDAGYGFTWLSTGYTEYQKTSGGLALNPMVGLLIPTGGQANFILSIGYKHNAFQTETNSGVGDYAYYNRIDYRLNKMSVKFGVNF